MKENDDVIIDEEGGDGEGSDGGTGLVKKLRERLKESQEKAQEYLTGWQKERADLVNARKRDQTEKEEFLKHAGERVIMDIIPSLDSFDMAMGNKESWEKLPSEWTKGIEYIYSQLLTALENHGIKRIYPLHQTFDPTEHEAIEMVPTEKQEDDNKVLSVIQPGYTLHGKPIRSAKVRVGDFGTTDKLTG